MKSTTNIKPKYYADIKAYDYLPDKHLDFIDSMAYSMSSYILETENKYVSMHIKKKPNYLPNFIYYWIIKRLLVITHFKK